MKNVAKEDDDVNDDEVEDIDEQRHDVIHDDTNKNMLILLMNI